MRRLGPIVQDREWVVGLKVNPLFYVYNLIIPLS